MGRWTVITELPLLSEVRARGMQAERELLAVQRRLSENGPDALGLDCAHVAGAPAWERIEAACRPDLFIELDGRLVWAELEIRPGRTLVLRRGRLE
jgi:hypothetical protein